MSGANSFKFVLLPPQSDTTRDWAKRLAEIVPEARVVVAEDADTAAREIVDAEAAFGWLGSDLLLKARKLRWLQAPQAAPPAGYYYPELTAHSVVVTNFREIFNDHIGAHILAFVLAFARGLHIFIPQQLRREWKKSPAESGDVPTGGDSTDCGCRRHRFRGGASTVGIRCDRAGDRRTPDDGARWRCGIAPAGGPGRIAASRRFRDPHSASHPSD
jgi:hypothetical protein